MAKYSGYDVLLKVKQGASYVAVAQIRDLSGPAIKQDTNEVTHRDGNKWREFVGGLRDGGEVSFDIVYDPDLASHGASATPGLAYMAMNGTVGDFQITWPDANPAQTCTFNALVTSFQPNAPMGDALTADVTLKITGSLTWA